MLYHNFTSFNSKNDYNCNYYGNSHFPQKSWRESPGGAGRGRTLALWFLLCSILSVALFHPPCRRKRARHSPVCALSRGLGLSEPLVPPAGRRDRRFSRLTGKKQPQLPRSRLVVGIMSVGNDARERERRRAVRERLANDPVNAMQNVTCPLGELLRRPRDHRDCKIAYAFLLGGNDRGTHLAFNRTYNSHVPYNKTTFFSEQLREDGGHRRERPETPNGTEAQFEERDVTFLNVRDVNDVRKVWAWYDYATKLRLEKGHQFDYVGVMMEEEDTDGNPTMPSSLTERTAHRVLDPSALLAENSLLRPGVAVPRTYAGVERSKADCGGLNASSACPRLRPDAYMSGELMVLSRDLVEYCLSHSNLIQLGGLYPQDRPDIALANLLSLHPRGVDRTPLLGTLDDGVVAPDRAPPEV